MGGGIIILVGLGIIATAKLISNHIAHVITYAGEVREDYDRQLSKAWGDIPELPGEMVATRSSGGEGLRRAATEQGTFRTHSDGGL